MSVDKITCSFGDEEIVVYAGVLDDIWTGFCNFTWNVSAKTFHRELQNHNCEIKNLPN